MIILGISAFYHDSSAAIVKDGIIVAAAQEEIFSRIKHDSTFPVNAIKLCMNHSKISASAIDYIIFYDKPFLKFERILETHISFAPAGIKSFIKSMPLWIKDKLFQRKIIIESLNDCIGRNNWESKLLFSEHHLSHAASAFFPSPFKEAAILTLDGVGEWATSSIAIGNKNSIDTIKEIYFPHSLGLLYSAFTYHCGFKVNSGEYKLMGLAPYGDPIYIKKYMKILLTLKMMGLLC